MMFSGSIVITIETDNIYFDMNVHFNNVYILFFFNPISIIIFNLIS